MTSQSNLNEYIGEVLTGKEFKRLFPELSNNLVKLTNEDENHNGFQFQTGINIDTLKFNPKYECLSGGIYFTSFDKIYMWLSNGCQIMKFCRKVVLLDESKIYIEHDKFKADQMILEERIEISDLDIWNNEDYCLKSVKVFSRSLSFIKNPSVAVQLAAVSNNGNTIIFIENPSEDIQLAAVNQDGRVIQYIENPSVPVQLTAVKQDSYAIKFIKNPSNDIQLTAVNKNGKALQFINNPIETIQLAAINKDGEAIRFIKNPSEAFQLLAIYQNADAIRFINDPSEIFQLVAVNKNGHAIEFIKNPTEAVKLAAMLAVMY